MNAVSQSDWQEGLPGELITQIKQAINQFHADEAYEFENGKLVETVTRLCAIETHCKGLLAAVGALSPVGLAVLYEKGAQHGVMTGRLELGDLSKRLSELARIATGASERLLDMHSPTRDSGQGAGSAIGRDSDLRAIKAEYGRKDFNFEFRSPKDKLGVAVLMAYFGSVPSFDFSARGAGRALESLLRDIWTEAKPGGSTDWKRLVHARHAIAGMAARSAEIQKLWKRARDKGSASSSE